MPLKRKAARSRSARELAVVERVINASGLIIWSAGPDGLCTYMSAYWTQLTGHSLRHVIGNGWLNYVHPEDRQRIMDEFHAALHRRQPITTEYRLIRRDGSPFWVRDHGLPEFVRGRFQGYVGTILEIDGRKRLEDGLREANSRYQLAARGTNQVIWDWDLVTGHVHASERALDVFGYPPHLYADTPSYLSFVHPRDRARVAGALEHHLQQHAPHDIEYRWRTPKGYRWLRTRSQAVWDSDGRPIRMAGSTADITDRKRAERRVALLNERLTQSNAALQHQSEALAALAQRLMEAGEQERSRVARELHDGLIQNLAYLQMRTARLAQTAPLLQQPLLELERLAEKIVDDVRRVARDLHSSVLDHLGLERALRSYCASLTQSGSVTIHVRRRGRFTEPPPATGLCLYRVAQEAIRNACRHSGASTVHVSLSGTPASATLRVEDKGSGFHPNAIGDGLGLTSMAERLRLAGGSFRLLTQPGKGTLVEAEVAWTV